MELRKISQKKLKKILESHKLWLKTDNRIGKRANLSHTDLNYADLSHANLSHANLNYADLSYANLNYADLSYADLYKADLSHANLYKADFFYAKIDDMISIGNIGNENRTVYYFYEKDRVICGCFDNTLEEFIKAVKEKYGNDYGSYKDCIKLFKMQ